MNVYLGGEQIVHRMEVIADQRIDRWRSIERSAGRRRM